MPHPTISKAGKWNATIQQGSTFKRVIRIPSIDLTGYSFRGQIRRNHSSTSALASYSFNLVDANSFEVVLSAVQSAALPAGEAVHDIEMFDPVDGFVARIIQGKVTVSPEVTR